MAVALGTNWNVSDDNVVGDRIRALREALGMTQEAVAAKSGGILERVRVTRLERGYNAASSWAQRVALARAFELRLWDVDAYLSGAITLDEALARRGLPDDEASRTPPVVVPEDRYPSRGRVLVALDGLVDPKAKERVATQANFGSRDPGPLYWIEALARAQREIETERALGVNPEHAAGAAAFERFAAEDAERAERSKAELAAARERKRKGE